MAISRITKRLIKRLLSSALTWDTDVRGFGVRRQRRDVVYVLKYRFKGRQRFYTIGLHGSPWSPEGARKEARRLLGMVHSHEAPRDPAAERDKAAGQPLLSEFAQKYLTEYAERHKKPRSVEEDRRNLEQHVLKVLGKLRVTDVSRSDIARFHSGRSEFPANANRCLAVLSHLFTMAEKWGYRPIGSNPCKGVERYQEKPRERLLSAEEIARLGDALARAARGWTKAELKAMPKKDRPKRAAPEDARAIACFRLLALTGARLSEILTLEWKSIDSERGIARLLDSKTGPKNLPLPAPALAILSSLRKVKGNPYVLPGDRKHRHFVGAQKPWQRVRKIAGLPDVRLHDLRHAFASIAVAGGDSLFLVGKVLGHRQATTTERYAHLQPDPIRAVADRAANRMAAMLEGGKGKTLPIASNQ